MKATCQRMCIKTMHKVEDEEKQTITIGVPFGCRIIGSAAETKHMFTSTTSSQRTAVVWYSTTSKVMQAETNFLRGEKPTTVSSKSCLCPMLCAWQVLPLLVLSLLMHCSDLPPRLDRYGFVQDELCTAKLTASHGSNRSASSKFVTAVEMPSSKRRRNGPNSIALLQLQIRRPLSNYNHRPIPISECMLRK